MEALLCTNATATAANLSGLPLPRRRTPPSTAALSALVSVPLSLRRRILPTRGLIGRKEQKGTSVLPAFCVRPDSADADWPETSFVSIAEKLDAEAATAREERASAGAGGEEKGRFGAINGVGGGLVEESVAVPFEQSLVAVDCIGDDALSQALGSKLDFEETSTYVIYGAGAFLAGWILSAVVSGIDSIPLLPKILEIVGLGYTIWFSTRYLLYKENRDELLVKVEDLKRRIIGSGDV